MRLWRSVSRHCAPCYTSEAWRVVARRHASSRSRIEVAREEHAENVRWSKQEEARAMLEPPPFDEDGATADEGALESLDAYLQARQWHHSGGPARRFLSHLLTYPLTLAAGVREAGLEDFPAPAAPTAQKEGAAGTAAHEKAVSNSGLQSSDSSSSSSSGSGSDSESGRSALAVVCLGARAESTMPPSFWRETLFALPGVSRLSLHLVGPELGVPPGVAAAAGQGRRSTTGGLEGGGGSARSASPSSIATHATVLPVGGRTLEVGWTRAMLGRAAPAPAPAPAAPAAAAGEDKARAGGSAAATTTAAAAAAADKAVADADAFVLFNPGLGHPHLREGWTGALERLLDSGKPIVVSCHSEADLERDARLLREAGAVRCRPDRATASGGTGGGVLPRKNAFRSLMASEDPLSAPGQEELVSCNWGIVVVRGVL